MSRWERTGWRDLTFSQAHRVHMDDHHKAVDLDLLGYDPAPNRSIRPRYLIESAQTTKPNVVWKPATVTAFTARRLGVPGLVVQYETEGTARRCECCGQGIQGSAGEITRFHVRKADGRRSYEYTPTEFWAHLRGLRDDTEEEAA